MQDISWGSGGTSERTEVAPGALQRLIEGEIIPRLLMAHRAVSDGAPSLSLVDAAVAPGTAATFAQAALKNEAYTLLIDIDAQLARGVSVETLFLDVLAPAARHLGDMWDRDECDFVDVTMALWRLQEIVHELAARMPGAAERHGGERRALFAPMPGEQHGFGSLMVEEFFRRAGWTTASEPGASEQELVGLVAKRWFEMVGITVACDDSTTALSRFITALRTHSRNPNLAVMVGGRVFVDHPEWAVECGADATAADGRQAVAVAETLVDGLINDAEHPASSRA
jgi:methanogenic corrinoid protein MtbC1